MSAMLSLSLAGHLGRSQVQLLALLPVPGFPTFPYHLELSEVLCEKLFTCLAFYLPLPPRLPFLISLYYFMFHVIM